MKKGILFIAMAFLITAGLNAQDQLRTNLKIQDKDKTMARDKDQIHTPVADVQADQDKDQLRTRKKDQTQDPDKDQLQTRKKDQIHQTDADVQADQDKDQLRTRKKDQTQDPDKDQLKTQDRIRLHTGVSAKPAGSAMKKAGAAGARKAQGGSGAGTMAKKATRSGMGPKR